MTLPEMKQALTRSGSLPLVRLSVPDLGFVDEALVHKALEEIPKVLDSSRYFGEPVTALERLAILILFHSAGEA